MVQDGHCESQGRNQCSSQRPPPHGKSLRLPLICQPNPNAPADFLQHLLIHRFLAESLQQGLAGLQGFRKFPAGMAGPQVFDNGATLGFG
jgi:hypothetical protein